MCAEKSSHAPLVKQGQALNVYFDSLLSDPQRQIPEQPKCSGIVSQNEGQSVCDSVDVEYQDNVTTTTSACLQETHFQVLFFKINDLTLATPLQDLSRTIAIPEKLVQFPDQPPWIFGVVEDQGDKIVLLDVPFLFKSHTRPNSHPKVSDSYRNVLITRNRRWGIPCDEVSAVSRLSSEDISWRRSANTKSWLLGTVTEKLCALIDLNHLIPLQSSR